MKYVTIVETNRRNPNDLNNFTCWEGETPITYSSSESVQEKPPRAIRPRGHGTSAQAALLDYICQQPDQEIALDLVVLASLTEGLRFVPVFKAKDQATRNRLSKKFTKLFPDVLPQLFSKTAATPSDPYAGWTLVTLFDSNTPIASLSRVCLDRFLAKHVANGLNFFAEFGHPVRSPEIPKDIWMRRYMTVSLESVVAVFKEPKWLDDKIVAYARPVSSARYDASLLASELKTAEKELLFAPRLLGVADTTVIVTFDYIGLQKPQEV